MNNPAEQMENQKRFKESFELYSDVVFRLCMYKTSDKNIALDITQEVFLRFWNTISSGKEVLKTKQYIYQIARNLIVDHYKVRAKKQTTSLDLLMDAGFSPQDDTSNPESLSEVSILRDVIEGMPESFKEVIYLKYIEGLRVKDISEMLGISENLVSIRINRGKKYLSAVFNKKT